jgi:hypothetical protein
MAVEQGGGLAAGRGSLRPGELCRQEERENEEGQGQKTREAPVFHAGEDTIALKRAAGVW